MATIAQRLQAEIDRANETTSKTDTTIHNAIGSLIEGYGKEEITWHQCPEAVRNYLDNVTYDPNDYSVSYVSQYVETTIRDTKPLGKTVDGVTYYNEVPNALTPFSSTNTAGTLQPLDQVRWLNTTTINCRDLGGWACDGGTVKYGMLVRGGEPESIDKTLMVNTVGIKHELQLRGKEEAPQTYSLWDIDYTCTDGYVWMALTNTTAWKQIFRCVFDNVSRNKPVYFHCHAGADRTGTVAVMLEAILGMSQSDIDKDYELTNFHTGTGTSTVARLRNEDEYKNYISAIKSVPLEGGLTDSFRNRAVSFCLSIGFTIDEINAFRTAMINGNPTAITVSMDNYSVTKSGSNITFDNDILNVDEYQGYKVNLSANSGYAISSLSITMGGVDITNQVFSGSKTTLNRSISTTLSYCTSDNTRSWTIDGQSFAMNLTADSGYTLDGGTVTITMGGVDMSTYYSNGKIAIPNVNGNIVISVTAVPSAPPYTNLADPTSADWAAGCRLNSSGVAVAVESGVDATNYIACSNGDVIRIKGLGALTSYNSAIYEGTSKTIYSAAKANACFISYEYDSANDIVTVSTNYANTTYVRFSGILTGTANDVIITKNEPII